METYPPTVVYHQAGAIPYRMVDDSLQVLLISTSSGKNWTIPKGLIDPGYSAMETVFKEAHEEAGIRGRLLTPPMGTYEFKKWGGRCQVEVFAMAVTRQIDRWPEDFIRRRVWIGHRQAAHQVKHSELGDLIRMLPKRLNAS